MRSVFLSILLLVAIRSAIAQSTETSTIKYIDTINRPQLRNMYGDLLDDDPNFNKKYPWYLVSARVLGANIFNWAVAKYVYKFDWTSSGINDWKNSFKKGPEWDTDGFGLNFIGHPHTGNYYYNIARSNGYSYFESFPFVLQGSLAWEFLGENTRPSYNDIINTPVSGMFLGEIFYRISSNVLDDRTRGRERVFREILAGLINPPRALNRLTQGKMKRVTTDQVYQREPLNITLNAGMHKINNQMDFASGATNAIVNLQFDYGNPFEERRRKPFDLFRFRIEGSYGKDRKLFENVNGYGILTGKNKKNVLFGLYQHFDYWNNVVFEVGTLGFGGGVIARKKIARNSSLYSTVHIGIVPFGGNNSRYGPDTSSFRTYNFGGGFQAKVEETLNLNKWSTIGFTGFYYFIHTYEGLPGNSVVGVFKPYLTVRLYKNISVGFEHFIYKNDRYLKSGERLHTTNTEQKLFLQIFLENGKRSGKYH